MSLNQDTKWMMEMLDNKSSFIHQKAFQPLKETIVRNLMTTYWIDADGEIYHQENELYGC